MLLIITLLGLTAKAQKGLSKPVKITSIEVSNENTAGVWLTFTPAPLLTHACPNKTTTQWMLGGGADNVDKMMSLATVAMVNSRTVTAWWGGDCDYRGYPVLTGLTLK
jgi:outer membrane receptor for monomeric catechols